MSKSGKSLKHLNEAYVNQINVLKALSSEARSSSHSRQYDISTISEKSGVNDEKETQRYLYILEGHKLVSPHPSGDFTSKLWHITDDGLKAVKTISSEFVA